MAQLTCYPTQGLTCGNANTTPVCTQCNTTGPHSTVSCCTSTTVNNSNNTNTAACSAWCVTECNSVCNAIQAYCNIGRETIVSHADVPNAPATGCLTQDQTIHLGWTAAYWNSLGQSLQAATQLGQTMEHPNLPGAAQPQTVTARTDVPTGDTNASHLETSLITAARFNRLATAIRHFNRAAPTNVLAGAVIMGTHAAGIADNFNGATFNNNVCDVCNTAGQTQPTCSCNCPCPCSCACGCACPCSCSCPCPCNVPY